MSTDGSMQSELAALAPKDPNYAVIVVERLLAAARRLGASDLHLRPTAEGLEKRLRIAAGRTGRSARLLSNGTLGLSRNVNNSSR